MEPFDWIYRGFVWGFAAGVIVCFVMMRALSLFQLWLEVRKNEKIAALYDKE